MDEVLHKAAGRPSDFSGTNFIGRDLGWVCASEIEAERMKRAISKLAHVEIRRSQPETASDSEKP